jgi:hypothetical protein
MNPTLLLDEVFDPRLGWSVPASQVSVERRLSDDRHPYYAVALDGISILTFEQTQWAAGVSRRVNAARVVAMTIFPGVEIRDPLELLKSVYDTRGFPALGIDPYGNLTLHTAFPIAPGFPTDLARKQLMVCLGLLAEEAKDLLRAWQSNGARIDWAAVTEWVKFAYDAGSTAQQFLDAFSG